MNEELLNLLRQHFIAGVRYNVIRRPLSGGKGSIVQKKGSKNVPPETKQEYYARLAQYIKDEPESYFMRWNVHVTPTDIQRFREQCLDPILESMCDWWSWIQVTDSGRKDATVKVQIGKDNFRFVHSSIHWRHPFGVWNSIDEVGYSDLDEYLSSGSTTGLQTTDILFPELQ